MDLKKTTFYLFTLFSLMLISCSNDDENKNDAQVTVTVVSADGKPLPNEIVQMFDEKTYEEFKKDNRTTPTAYALTNSTGVATFIFTYDKWFESNKDRFFHFRCPIWQWYRKIMKYGLQDVPYAQVQLHKSS
ncbi:Ig-like domain-containing protein [Bacteroides fragilis]|nr:Ig-like domain-containing protein [Bacteroides fragilis]